MGGFMKAASADVYAMGYYRSVLKMIESIFTSNLWRPAEPRTTFSNLLTAIDPSNKSGVCALPHPSQSLGELFVRPAPLEALLQPAVIPEIKMSRAASEACMRLRFAASGPFTSRADATPVLELRFKA